MGSVARPANRYSISFRDNALDGKSEIGKRKGVLRAGIGDRYCGRSLAFLRSSRKRWGRLVYAVFGSGLVSATWFSMFPTTAKTYAQSVVEGGVHWERIQVQEVNAFPGIAQSCIRRRPASR
jgi:hypothetical protein